MKRRRNKRPRDRRRRESGLADRVADLEIELAAARAAIERERRSCDRARRALLVVCEAAGDRVGVAEQARMLAYCRFIAERDPDPAYRTGAALASGSLRAALRGADEDLARAVWERWGRVE